ncbi:hypothetical protein VIGAN_01275100 [Vigna angularis var. angularis]|uniref:Uncharacterized protein n=1 Tax=Vigna angularis var. angularis TaxID=157739 RepID=A0A0S3R2P9_PHAAN|nr:hypothetical protein VIGAN_01275100 [Vigna angularis var. angularis]
MMIWMPLLHVCAGRELLCSFSGVWTWLCWPPMPAPSCFLNQYREVLDELLRELILRGSWPLTPQEKEDSLMVAGRVLVFKP